MYKNLNKRIASAIGAAAMALVFTVSGCADTQAREAITPTPTEVVVTPAPTEEPTPEPTETPTPEPSYVSFGEETSDSLSAVFENGTEQAIKGIAVRSSEEKDFGEDLMQEGEQIAPGEMFRVFVSPADTQDASASPSEEAAASDASAADPEEVGMPDVQFNETYDIRLTLADDTQPVLYDLGFDDIDTGVITYSASDEVAYVTYVSTKTAQTISTLDAQIARVTDEAAALAEEQHDAETTPARNDNTGAQSTKKPASTSAGTGNGTTGGGGTSNGGGTTEETTGGGTANGGTANDGGGHTDNDNGGGGGNNDDNDNGGGNADEGPGQNEGTCIDEDDIEWLD